MITPGIADALYVGLVTDTGRFMYENTSPEAHRMAAELIEAGVQPHQVYRRLWEDLPFRRLQLLQRALASVERHDDGVDHDRPPDEAGLRGHRGARDGLGGRRRPHARRRGHARRGAGARAAWPRTVEGMRKVSLRATDGSVDVSRLARGLRRRRPPAGRRLLDRRAVPGARRAAPRAGPRAARGPGCLTAPPPADGVLLVDKPAGVTSHDVVARVRRELPRGTKVGHAGTLDPFATGLLLVLVGRATRAQRFLMALPKTYRAVARLGWTSDTGDRDGRLTRTGRVPERLEIPCRRAAPAPAGALGRAGGREARLRAGPERRAGRARAAADPGAPR